MRCAYLWACVPELVALTSTRIRGILDVGSGTSLRLPCGSSPRAAATLDAPLPLSTQAGYCEAYAAR
jgi:hypothetical protein